jgi:hypothetical protein
MAYTDDAVLAKLSALNETQESIVSPPFCCLAEHSRLSDSNLDISLQVTVAQWVMFHRYAIIPLEPLACHISDFQTGDTQTALDSSGSNASRTLEVTKG